MAATSLKEKTAKGLLWGGLSNGVQQVLNLVFGIFLACMLTPADYGMVGMLAVFSLIAVALQESGFTAALVNKKEIRHEDYNAVFWFSLLISSGIYLILFDTHSHLPATGQPLWSRNHVESIRLSVHRICRSMALDKLCLFKSNKEVRFMVY